MTENWMESSASVWKRSTEKKKNTIYQDANLEETGENDERITSEQVKFITEEIEKKLQDKISKKEYQYRPEQSHTQETEENPQRIQRR